MNVSLSDLNNTSVLHAHFECYGNEMFLYNCSDKKTETDTSSQHPYMVAGVICRGNDDCKHSM